MRGLLEDFDLARGVSGSDTEHVESESESSKVAAQAQALLGAARHYVSQVLPRDEVAEVRRVPTIAMLEQHGVSLEKHFAWFVLRAHTFAHAHEIHKVDEKLATSLLQNDPKTAIKMKSEFEEQIEKDSRYLDLGSEDQGGEEDDYARVEDHPEEEGDEEDDEEDDVVEEDPDFDDEGVMDCTEIFNIFDKHNTGVIPVDLLRQIMHAMGQNPDKEELKTINEQVDADNSGGMSRDECSELVRIAEERSEAQLSKVFVSFDLNGDGTITVAELHQVMVQLGISRLSAETMIKKVDENHDGIITYAEFIKLIGLKGITQWRKALFENAIGKSTSNLSNRLAELEAGNMSRLGPTRSIDTIPATLRKANLHPQYVDQSKVQAIVAEYLMVRDGEDPTPPLQDGKPLSRTNIAAYKEYRRYKRLRLPSWLELTPAINDNVNEVVDIYDAVFVQYMKVNEWIEFFKTNGAKSLKELETSTIYDIYVSIKDAVNGQIKAYLNIFKRGINAVKRLWVRFKSKLTGEEAECAKEGQEEEKASVKKWVTKQGTERAKNASDTCIDNIDTAELCEEWKSKDCSEAPKDEQEKLLANCPVSCKLCEGCWDTPDWGDWSGYTCEHYAEEQYCTASGGQGPGWLSRWGKISEWGVDDIDATMACCACGGGMKANGLADEMDAAGNALGELSEGAEEADAEAHAQVEAFKVSSEEFEKLQTETAYAPTGDENANRLKVEAAMKAETDIDKAQRAVCQSGRKQGASAMKDTVRKLREAASDALPNIGIRGVGGRVSVFGGGLEEVVDFRNKEIGYFAGNGVSMGASWKAMSVMGYAGIGWKNSKIDWSLDEQYHTGLWVMASVQGKMPLGPLPLSVTGSVGVGFKTDADDTAGLPWLPEADGMKSIVLGYSVGASVDVPGTAGASVTVDYGGDRYRFITSECFDGLGDFTRNIWKTYCGTCGYQETGRLKKAKQASTRGLTALRTAVHVASFPIITDLAFTYLAWKNHQKYPTPAACSAFSVQNLQNASKFAIRAAHYLQETTKQLELLKFHIDRFKDSVENLQDEYGDEKPLSTLPKVRNWYRQMEKASCRKYPFAGDALGRKVMHDGAQTTWNQGPRTKRTTLLYMSRNELKELCKNYTITCGRSKYLGRYRSTEWIRKRLVEAISRGQASTMEPLGTCTKDKQCRIRKMVCTEVYKEELPRCACKPGYCFRWKNGEPTCQKTKGNHFERAVRGIQSWVKRTELRVGLFANSLSEYSLDKKP